MLDTTEYRPCSFTLSFSLLLPHSSPRQPHHHHDPDSDPDPIHGNPQIQPIEPGLPRICPPAAATCPVPAAVPGLRLSFSRCASKIILRRLASNSKSGMISLLLEWECEKAGRVVSRMEVVDRILRRPVREGRLSLSLTASVVLAVALLLVWSLVVILL